MCCCAACACFDSFGRRCRGVWLEGVTGVEQDVPGSEGGWRSVSEGLIEV